MSCGTRNSGAFAQVSVFRPLFRAVPLAEHGARAEHPRAAAAVIALPHHAPHLTARGWLVIAALAVGWFVYYLVACAFYPFAACWVCKGEPRRFQNKRRKAWRRCWWCKGTGERLRVGRRIWNYMRQTKAKGTK